MALVKINSCEGFIVSLSINCENSDVDLLTLACVRVILIYPILTWCSPIRETHFWSSFSIDKSGKKAIS